MNASGTRKSSQKVMDQCLNILKSVNNEATLKWIADNKLKSMTIRNVKALQIISLSNYMLEKILINKIYYQNQLLNLLLEYYKKNSNKCIQFAHLVKHFSEWDYEFEFIYQVALDQNIQQIGLYLRVREVLRSDWNRAKKEILSGITKQLEEWATIAKIVFKQKEEEDVIDHFTTVVKSHYMHVKKSQSEKINGAEFLKICQIMDNSDQFSEKRQGISPKLKQSKSQGKNVGNIVKIFDQTVLSGLTTQDKQLIRVLSYKDKNIAHMLEEKHTKMVHLIGEEVNQLRTDINRQKQRYIEVVEQKNRLLRMIERIKQSSLKYIINKSESNEFQLLQQLDSFNKKYNQKATDVSKTTDIINNRRLIDIIQREELQQD